MRARGVGIFLLTAWLLPLLAGGTPELSGARGPLLLAQAGAAARGSTRLADYYRDPGNGFAIRPPNGWYQGSRGGKFLVKFSSPDLKASIIIDLVKLPTPIQFNSAFADFVNAKNREVAAAVPSFRVISNRNVNLNNKVAAYRTAAVFAAGQNRALMNIYYIPVQNRLFMISTVYPEAAAAAYENLILSSIATFSLI